MKTLLQQQQQLPEDTVTRYWWISLLTGGVVIGAVALLLTILVRTVEQIQEGVAQIWQVGKLIANNTVHIPLLAHTNLLVGQIHESAGGIVQSTERIERAAAGDSRK